MTATIPAPRLAGQELPVFSGLCSNPFGAHQFEICFEPMQNMNLYYGLGDQAEGATHMAALPARPNLDETHQINSIHSGNSLATQVLGDGSLRVMLRNGEGEASHIYATFGEGERIALGFAAVGKAMAEPSVLARSTISLLEGENTTALDSDDLDHVIRAALRIKAKRRKVIDKRESGVKALRMAYRTAGAYPSDKVIEDLCAAGVRAT